MHLVLNRNILTLLLLSGLLLSSGVCLGAPSTSDIKQAAEAFDRGRVAYRAESYVEAAEQFEAADDRAASAAALRLAIASRQAADQLDRALTLAALALKTYPDDPEVQEQARQVIDENAAQFARIDVSCDEPCELTLDRKLVHGPRATEHVVYVVPGTHQVQAGFGDDRSEGRRVAALADETRSVELFAPEVPIASAEESSTSWYDEEEAKPEPEEEPKGWSPAVFWTSFGLTAVGVAVTTGLGVNAMNNPGQERVKSECDSQNYQDCELYRQGVANQTAANVAGGMTAALGAFTIVTGIWLTNWSGKKKEKSPAAGEAWSLRAGSFRIRPTVSVGDGATLGAVGTF